MSQDEEREGAGGDDPAPLFEDLRERVAAAVDPHEGSPLQIARTFRVRLSFVVRLLQRRRDAGTLEPQPQGGSPPLALGSDDRQRLDGLLAERPDATLEQLKERSGFRCRLTTRWRALRRRRLTPKKKSLSASQRDRPDVQKKRRAFRRKVSRIEPKRLIFIDEAGVTTARTPASAWAPRGAWAVDSAPTTWATRTVITALGRDGVCAPLAFPGSTDTAASQSYVEQSLAPQLGPGDVVIWDNLKPHQAPELRRAVERAGARLVSLLPYSPDLTPIEEMWSKVEEFLRSTAARTTTAVYDAMGLP
jgi:transposase